MTIDRFHLYTAFGYAILGMVLGIVMAASQNHAQHVTHAHILLVGFVVSFLYAVTYRLWIPRARGWMPKAQFGAHHVGAALMFVGLFMLYSGRAPSESLEPLLAASSIAVLVGVVLMAVLAVTQRSAERHGVEPALDEV